MDTYTFMCTVMAAVFCGAGSMEPAAKKLHFDLMKKNNYNPLIKPAGSPTGGPVSQLTVKIGMRLSQILDVDEKNQIIKISVWLRQLYLLLSEVMTTLPVSNRRSQTNRVALTVLDDIKEWYDMRLQWDPEEYGGVKKLHIPSNDLWKPDLVLYNNADGDFVVTLQTKATVHHNGWIVWEPPAIYKSYCEIDVEFFPFDMQECFLKFGSWTYDGTQLDLQHVCDNGVEVANNIIVIDRGIDLRDFYANIEWDIINATAQRRVKYYPCCPEPYPDIMFNVTLRRRTLFYTLNLIMPCISISCLTVLVFYLPADSAEKITLCISILLALTMFFLLLSDITPPTSLVIPLIGKYLLFVLIVVSLSIFLTVYTLHINFKTPTTHKMSPWVRKVFTEILPRILLMKRPVFRKNSPVGNKTCNGTEAKEPLVTSASRDRHTYENVGQGEHLGEPEVPKSKFAPCVTEALYGVKFIADHLKKEDEDMMEVRDWKYIAMVMDRFFLVIFSTACFCGTVSIFLFAPSLYDPRLPLANEDPNNTCVY